MAVNEVVEEKIPLNKSITAMSGGALAVIDEDFGEYEGAGFQNMTAEHLALPVVIVLQSNSPQCKPAQHGGVDGAKPGMLYNQATGELYDGEEGVQFIPVDVDEKYVEFFPREDDGSGGGFVSVRTPEDPLIARLRADQGKFGKLRYEEGVDGEPTELSQTFSIIGCVVPNWDIGEACRVVVPFTSTKIKGYKAFSTRADKIKYWSSSKGAYQKPPMWAHRYVMKTVYVPKGSLSWYIISVELDGKTKEEAFIPHSDPLRRLGEETYKIYTTGDAKVVYDKMGNEEGPNDSTDAPF